VEKKATYRFNLEEVEALLKKPQADDVLQRANCKNCGGKIMYLAHKLERINSVPIVSCPACRVIVPELGGAKVIAYFRERAGKAGE